MIRLKLLGVQAVVEDPRIQSLLEPHLVKYAGEGHWEVNVQHPYDLDGIVPGLITALLTESKHLNSKAMPLERFVIRDGSVRAEPPSVYDDPRPSHAATEIRCFSRPLVTSS